MTYPQGDLTNVLTEYDEEPGRSRGTLSKSKAVENLSQEDLVELNKEDKQTAKNGVRGRGQWGEVLWSYIKCYWQRTGERKEGRRG